ncbi:hypothetical protein JHK86_027900 [Glycine max]|nr:hypothetical protein JHK86_027900 [Glycine max]
MTTQGSFGSTFKKQKMRLLITSKDGKHLWQTKQAERSRGFVLIMILSSVLNLSLISVKRLALQGTG